MRGFQSLCLILVFLFLPAVSQAHRNGHSLPPETKIEITHHDQKSGALIMREDRKESIRNGIFTSESRYFKPDGTLVQRQVSVYHQENLRIVSFLKEHIPTGLMEKMTVEGDSVVMEFRKRKGEKIKKETLKLGVDFLFGSTLGGMIIRDWNRLQKGEKVPFNFLVPSRLETLVFRFSRDREETINGEKVSVFRMEPDSWIIRALVDPLYFFYTNDHPHKLLRYTGRSSVAKDNGDDQDLVTNYKYP